MTLYNAFPEIARQHSQSWPTSTALVDGDVRITYRDLDKRVRRLTRYLVESGITAGERIMWLGQNSHRLLEIMLAAANTGAIVCPINWRLTEHEIAGLLDRFDPKLIILQANEVGGILTNAVTASNDSVLYIQDGGEGTNEYEQLLADTVDPFDVTELPVTDLDAPWLALYTGGFDGTPKAAMLSQSALLSQSHSIATVSSMGMNITSLACGPLFHIGTMALTVTTFVLAGTNVFMPRFNAEDACRLIEVERCEYAFLVPSMIAQILECNKGRRFDLSSLRSSYDSQMWKGMVSPQLAASLPVLPGYGQTETSGMLTFSNLRGVGEHGRPAPAMQVRVMGEDGSVRPPGEIGEITARGPHIMNGYFRDDISTRTKMRDGWLHTGDLGRLEPDGSLTFVGPRQRMIRSGSENIYPVEVERRVVEHPAVEECAVIGVPDEKWLQVVHAVVVVKDQHTIDEAELIDFIGTGIGAYKKPRSVHVLAELPRRGGAVDYDELDLQFGGGGYPGS